MKASRLVCAVLAAVFVLGVPAAGQTATVTESLQSFRTYPFGDPSPVPRMGNVYPYFRFDGYSTTSTDKSWKVVTLENPYIKVLIAPEIGGKILGAFEQSSGQAFLYYNKVVKFREIAMRGPWTSGGIEFNFGDIGHAPSTATPVEYLSRTNADGSVSCFVGAIDLPSRTVWRVEIRLPRDKAYFETRSFWYNPTSHPTSLYHWMNAAADASLDLLFVYPGTAYIDHGGKVFAYPLDSAGRNISKYANNAFGSHKSYHVLGSQTNFFGAYYTEKDFGVMHWSRYEEKPGKKIWMWSQARDGEIWVDLLTDPELGNGQYVEIQSGLLFNQAGASSSLTPFKHQFLGAHRQERFSEAWFPVLKTGGVVQADLTGSLNLERKGSSLTLAFCPVRFIDEVLVVTAGGDEILRKKLRLRPLEVYRTDFEAPEDVRVSVTLGNGQFTYQEDGNSDLLRPTSSPDSYDWNSPSGLYTRGVEYARQRDFGLALDYFRQCLEKDPLRLDALAMASECHAWRTEYREALELAKRALAIDAYDGGANFIYGVVNRRLSFLTDAKDGFAKAARSSDYHSAANTELAEIALLEKKWGEAVYFAQSAIAQNRFDMRAHRVAAIVSRITKRPEMAQTELASIEEFDPLDHFARFERYLLTPTKEKGVAFASGIRSELPHETFLELAIDYAELGLTEEAALVLELAPDQPIVSYWKAFLAAKVGESAKSKEDLEAALGASAALVFPHRSETVRVLEWAEAQSPHWKNKYYLGLLAWSRGQPTVATRYLDACGNQPDFSPFYISRSILSQSASAPQAERDLRRAVDVGPAEWRAYRILASFYTERGEYSKALSVLKEAASKFPANYVILFDYAKSLLHSQRYDESMAILDTLTVLPFEGARYGRQTYREACVFSALEMMKQQDFAGAIMLVAKARQWPEHLGVGKPHEVDERIEDFLEAHCRAHLGQEAEARGLLEQVAMMTTSSPATRSAASLLSATALRRLGRSEEGGRLLSDWTTQDAENLLAQWAVAVYEDESQAAESLLGKASRTSGSGPWYIFPTDPDFLLVNQIAKTIGIR